MLEYNRTVIQMPNYIYTQLEDGNVKIKRYVGKETRITIPRKIDGYSVTEIGESAFRDQPQLVSVIVPDSVLSICSKAFCGCTSLSSLYLPRSVKHIGADVFDGCPKLKLFVCSESPAYEYVRSCCPSAKYAVADMNPAQIERLIHGIPETYVCGRYVYALNEQGHAKIIQYKGPQYIDEVFIPEFLDGYQVQEIGDCAFMKTMVGRFVVPESVKRIGRSAFENCARTEEIILMKGLCEIGERAFYSSGLTCLVFPDTVKWIGSEALCFCRALREVRLPSGLKTIAAKMFWGDRALRHTQIPETVSTIEALAFADSNHHSKIIIPEWVKHIDDSAFAGCKDLLLGIYPESEGFRFAKANDIPAYFVVLP